MCIAVYEDVWPRLVNKPVPSENPEENGKSVQKNIHTGLFDRTDLESLTTRFFAQAKSLTSLGRILPGDVTKDFNCVFNKSIASVLKKTGEHFQRIILTAERET